MAVGRLTSDEQTGEDDHTLTGTRGVLGGDVVESKVTDRGKGHEANEHEDGADDQRLATTKVLNDIETAKGGSEVDGTQDDLGDEAVGDTSTLHDGGTVVEEVVGTGKLLQRLKNHAQEDTVEHARSSEELVPLLLLGLGVKLLLDLVQLFDDAVVVLGDTVELGEVATGVVDTAVTVVETRRLGEEEHATTEGKGEEEGQTQSDTPLGGTALDILGAKVDEVGEEDTEGDEELVATDDGTTDVTGGGFTWSS